MQDIARFITFDEKQTKCNINDSHNQIVIYDDAIECIVRNSHKFFMIDAENEEDLEEDLERIYKQIDLLIREMRLAIDHKDKQVLMLIRILLNIFINPRLLEYEYIPTMKSFKKERLFEELFKYEENSTYARMFRTAVDTTTYWCESTAESYYQLSDDIKLIDINIISNKLYEYIKQRL